MFARTSALLTAFVLAMSGLAAAQETTGTIGGRVVDAQGLPIPGATITLTGAQGTRTFATDGEGRFFAPFLTPGVYTVRAELTGFKATEQQDVSVSLGTRREVNLTLEAGGITETVQVTAAATVVDVTSTTAGGILDSDMLSRLPVGRNFTDTLYLVPGVSDSSGVGRANPSIGGGSGLENSYVVDGVNITDTGFGGVGSYNSVHGSLGSGVTTDFIKETQVRTAGFEAEYGETTGGVVNVITKSGGNRFSGGAFSFFRPGALEGEWKPLSAPNGTVNTVSRNEYDLGISLGGPIAANRLFYYGTYNPQFQNRSFIAPDPTPAGVVFPYRSLGEVERKRRLNSYAGKLSAQLDSSNRLDFSVFGDPSKGLSGLQRFSTLRRIAYQGAPGTADISGGYSELVYGGHNQTVRYDGIVTSRWLLEGAISRASNEFDEIPTVDDWIFTDLRSVPFGATGGLGSYERDKGSNLQFSAKSTHMIDGAGNHQIRYGVGFDDIRFTRDFDYSGRNLTLGNGRQTVTGGPIQIRTGGGVTFFRATRGKLIPAAETVQHYYSLFLQDTWQAGRLTLRPGVRWERQYLEGVDPAGDFPDLCFENDTRPGAGDGSGAPIACNFTWNNVAPRIGATYDLTGSGRAKVYASWGRFYAKIPNDLAARAMSSDTGITRQNFRDAALTQPLANGTSYAGTTTHLLLTSDHAAIIDPDAGSTYKDEFLAGVEFEVLDSANLGIRYIRRTNPQILEDIGEFPVVGYYLDPDTPVDYFITNVNAGTSTVTCCGLPLTHFEDPAHTYDSVEITLNKRITNNWGAIASYRFSRLAGNFEGFFRSDNGQSDPAITSLFDFPTDDPTYTSVGVPEFGFQGDIRYQGTTLGSGVLPNDRPHQLKIYGNYIWNALNLGMGLNWGTGRSLTGLAANPVYANAGEIPLTLRGEGFQTADGFRKRAPADATFDVHADYRLGAGTRNVQLIADVFNLFNRRSATDYDNWFETTVGTLNPNYGHSTNGGGSSTASFQAPLSVRLGIRFDW